MTLSLILLVFAFVLFVVAAWLSRVQLVQFFVAAGLALLTLALILGPVHI